MLICTFWLLRYELQGCNYIPTSNCLDIPYRLPLQRQHLNPFKYNSVPFFLSVGVCERDRMYRVCMYLRDDTLCCTAVQSSTLTDDPQPRGSWQQHSSDFSLCLSLSLYLPLFLLSRILSISLFSTPFLSHILSLRSCCCPGNVIPYFL